MVDRSDMRVSDAERRAAGERLRLAMSEGRLDFAEFDARLTRAFGAVTYRDLDALFVDLPAVGRRAYASAPPVARPAPVPAPGGVGHLVPRPLRVLWTVWISVVLVNLTVWLLVSLGDGNLQYFWPMWLLVPAAPLFGITAGAVASHAVGRRPR